MLLHLPHTVNIKKHKRYLIIAETDDTGYFVEFQSDLEYALKRAQLFFDLAFQPGSCDQDLLAKEFSILASYPIYDQYIVLEKHHGGTSNGFCSTDVLEVDDNFNLKRYSLLRASAQSVFKGEEKENYFDFLDSNTFSGSITFWVN